MNWPSVATPLRYTYSNRLLTGESDRRGRNVNASVYDSAGRLTSITDAGGTVTTFAYNLAART